MPQPDAEFERSMAAIHARFDEMATKADFAALHRKLDIAYEKMERLIAANRRTNLRIAKSAIRQGYGHLVREHLPHLHHAILR